MYLSPVQLILWGVGTAAHFFALSFSIHARCSYRAFQVFLCFCIARDLTLQYLYATTGKYAWVYWPLSLVELVLLGYVSVELCGRILQHNRSFNEKATRLMLVFALVATLGLMSGYQPPESGFRSLHVAYAMLYANLKLVVLLMFSFVVGKAIQKRSVMRRHTFGLTTGFLFFISVSTVQAALLTRSSGAAYRYRGMIEVVAYIITVIWWCWHLRKPEPLVVFPGAIEELNKAAETIERDVLKLEAKRRLCS